MKLVWIGERGEKPVAVIFECLNWEGTPRDFFDKLKVAATRWLRGCPDGQRVLVENRDRFTVADLADYARDAWANATMLSEMFRAVGLPHFDAYVLEATPPEGLPCEFDENLFLEGDHGF